MSSTPTSTRTRARWSPDMTVPTTAANTAPDGSAVVSGMPETTADPSGAVFAAVVGTVMSGLHLARARVEVGVDDIGEDVGHEHRQRDHEEHALHEGEVLGV